MTVWVILVVLIGLIFLLGGLIAILLLTQPRHKATPARLCPNCGQAIPAGAASCPGCQQGPSDLPAGHLVTLSGPLVGQSFPLQPPPRGLVIGRAPDSDVIVDALMVSRHHAQVMVEGEQVVLYDRDSTNGTWLIDGRRVSRYVLSLGDQFQIGDTAFAYALPGQPLPSQPPPSPSGLKPITDLRLQSYFEGYLLLDVLGHGGMSVVYRAQAPGGTQVAIKVLDITDEWVARKFVQEGNIGAALRGSPYIRVVHDLRYSQDGRPYLVMEYVEGSSLRKLLRNLMPVSQIVNIIGQTCQALEFAHQRQIVHRDIKPENILVERDGGVKVTDFGIAKITSAVTVTSDRIVGTPEYISPEQAKGEAVGPVSDIYSLGVVLYELLTGQVPFPLPTTSSSQDPRSAAYTVIRQHIYEAPTPPGQLNPVIASSPLEEVALKALEKDPLKRYKRATELAGLLGYQPSQPLSAPMAEVIEARLMLLDGPNRNQVIPVNTNHLVVGRALIDPANVQISRQHAILMQKGEGWWIQDVSKNGTWVNGQRVYGEAPLTGDRIIEIAGYKMQLRY